MFKLRPKLHKPTATNETGISVNVATKLGLENRCSVQAEDKDFSPGYSWL